MARYPKPPQPIARPRQGSPDMESKPPTSLLTEHPDTLRYPHSKTPVKSTDMTEQEQQIEQVKNQVCTYYRVTFEQIIDKNQSKQVSSARNMLMYILHCDLGVSFGVLSKMLNRTSRNVQMRVADTKYIVENQKKYQKQYTEIKAI